MSNGTPQNSSDRQWYLYVIECKGGRLYTGISVNVEARFQAHCTGKGARFTKAFPPERLLFSAGFKSRQTASKAEYDFKSLSAAEKRRFIATHAPQEKP